MYYCQRGPGPPECGPCPRRSTTQIQPAADLTFQVESDVASGHRTERLDAGS